MRNIKFRAWDTKLKQMQPWRVIKNNDVPSFHMDDDFELMQYTEIKDDKGIEIYEGDIIQRTSMAPGGINLVGVVEFAEGSWWITTCDDAEFLFDEVDKIEIIGNKYESK